MDKIHIGRSGTNLGEFSEAEVREGLRTGRFLPTDLGWHAGLSAWTPLAQIESLSSAPPLPELPPMAPPLADVATATGTGPAWEQREAIGWSDALVETLRSVLLEPTATFTKMRKVGDLQSPLLYYVLVSCAGGIISLLYQLIIQNWTGASLNTWQIPIHGLAIIPAMIILPIFAVIGVFVSAGVTHLCLMLVGGANHPFDTTLRATCYSLGSTAALQIIPACGGFVALIWMCVTFPIAIARGQEISMGKAVLALVLPSLVCCGLLLVLVMVGYGSLMFHQQ